MPAMTRRRADAGYLLSRGRTQGPASRRADRGPRCLTLVRFAINGHRQLGLIDVAAGFRPVVEFLLELERTVTDGVQDRRDHLQMRSRVLQLP
jgi:hypothetical protein